MTVIPARDGKTYYLDPDGNYWRSYVFIENATAYQKIKCFSQDGVIKFAPAVGIKLDEA